MAEQDIKDEISEDELDQIIQDMSKEEEEAEETVAPETIAAASAPAPAAKPSLEVVQSKKAAATAASSPQALTLEMTGTIHLKLNFKNGDRSIDVVCGEDALVCTLADGTEFRIPTGNAKARKAA